ncbi:MAG: CaiB/BaiF CoA transferase family protein [Dehalococcoidia bacterium]
MKKRLPLEGVRVIDITVVWAGPHCTQLLAEWGAEVIRVEPLQHVQTATRGMEYRTSRQQAQTARGIGSVHISWPNYDPGERPFNRYPAFNSHARNKKSMTLDVTFPEARRAFEQLICVADVLVENNVPETGERGQFTYPELAAINPALIELRMPAYGLDGPYKNYRSYGTHMEAMTGHHHLRGYPNLDPSSTGDAFTADAAAGVMGAYAVVLALRHRRRTGKGQQIELPQAENFLSYLAEPLMDFAMNGRETEPQGNQHPSHAPHGVYPCAGEDRWIAIDVGDDSGWRGLCEALKNPAWTDDDRFKNPLFRWRHRLELDGTLAAETRRHDAVELWRRLLQHGVVAGPVQNERDLFACPQLRERGFFVELVHPEAGTHEYPGFSFKMQNTPNTVRRHPVMLGEDNDFVYHDLLALDAGVYDDIVARGHVGRDFPDAHAAAGA